jgi:ATP-dependent protease Clp ATPase subunit
VRDELLLEVVDLPVRAHVRALRAEALDPLDEESLVRILCEPKNALVRQYQKLFDMEGAELEFESEALHEIARLAKQRDTACCGASWKTS